MERIHTCTGRKCKLKNKIKPKTAVQTTAFQPEMGLFLQSAVPVLSTLKSLFVCSFYFVNNPLKRKIPKSHSGWATTDYQRKKMSAPEKD